MPEDDSRPDSFPSWVWQLAWAGLILVFVLTATIWWLGTLFQDDRKDASPEEFARMLRAIDGSDYQPEMLVVPLDVPHGARPLEMVLVPAGTFSMGSPADEEGRVDGSEWLPHPVALSRSFYLGKTEVTQAHWEAVLGEPFPSRENVPMGLDYPAAKLSWNQCLEFVEALNRRDLGRFRLPTEAEWEYACRAGTTTRYSFGDSLENAGPYLWWSHNSGGAIREVGRKLANGWGLHDMHGNVMEWCFDRWEGPYERGARIDPSGPPGSAFRITNYFPNPWGNRVLRGGSVHSGYGSDCRSAARYREQPFDYHYTLGLRIARELD
jgi:formylglycine-generating enzyme required for sulfatase activity